MNVFDIIGPVMIGPSSSHTAGAVRLGQIALAIFGHPVKKAVITLYGSFAKTHKGHGTDRALIGGLLGMKVDDERIKNAFEIASEQGLEFTFNVDYAKGYHPNTAKLELFGDDCNDMVITGASVGGGKVMVNRINDLEVSFTCEYHTLIISHNDREGVVARVGQLLADSHVNIAQMRLFRHDKGGQAVMVIETDHAIETALKQAIRDLEPVHSVAVVRAIS